MSYASFEPLPEDVERKRIAEKAAAANNHKTKEAILKQHKFKELKSDYLGTFSLYFDSERMFIWMVHNGVAPVFTKPTWDMYEHISKLNSITGNYSGQPAML